MIYGNINYLGERYEYPEKIYELLKYLQRIDIFKMPKGITEIEGKDVYIDIQELEKMPLEERKGEVHRKYIDIQFSASGKELYGFAPDNGKNEVVEDVLEERDILFLDGIQNEKYIDSNPGDFFVFFPNDVHRSIYKYGNEKSIRKAIVKIAIDKL